MAQPAVFAATLALTLFLGLHRVSGQWMRGTGENLADNITSDYMYRFRVAVTPKSNLIYGISGLNESIAQYNFNRSGRGIQTPAWSSPRIPGLTEKQPVLNVDSTTDQVYFIHPVDGKIYCYDASLGPNATKPVWVSTFVCSAPANPRDQHLQAFTSNGKALLARCNNSVMLLGVKGALVKNFSSPNVQSYVAASDLAAPIPVFNNFTRMLTWFTNDTGSYLEIWQLDGSTRAPIRAAATVPLPAGVIPSGVNSDSPWWAIVADIAAPAVHVLSPFTGKFQSVYNFKTLVDPEDTMVISVLPTPVIVNRTMYGVVQGLLPSPFPWLPAQYPDTYSWWMFAVDYSVPKSPVLQWITTQQSTRGPMAPQVPWVTARGVFITDYQQNATRSFDRVNGLPLFSVPANPYLRVGTAYSLIKGTYKISLPWVSPDGFFEVFQYDDWQYDMAAPEVRGALSRGCIRAMVGFAFSPPRSPSPPLPPPM